MNSNYRSSLDLFLCLIEIKRTILVKKRSFFGGTTHTKRLKVARFAITDLCVTSSYLFILLHLSILFPHNDCKKTRRGLRSIYIIFFRKHYRSTLHCLLKLSINQIYSPTRRCSAVWLNVKSFSKIILVLSQFFEHYPRMFIHPRKKKQHNKRLSASRNLLCFEGRLWARRRAGWSPPRRTRASCPGVRRWRRRGRLGASVPWPR